MNDPILAAACTAVLALMIGAAEASRRLLSVPHRVTRMAVHLAAGVMAAFVPLLFEGPLWPSLVALAAVVLVGLARLGGHLPALHAARPRSWGTVWFPAAALVLYNTVWAYPHLVTLPLLVMAFADVAGVLVGEGMRSPRRLPEGMEGKSWDGSVAVFAMAGLAVNLGWEAFGLSGTGTGMLVGLSVAPVAAAVEAVSRNGLDNFTLPLACALNLWIIEITGGDPLPLLAAEALALVVAMSTVRWRLLRPDGGTGAFLLAAWLLGGGGWPWALPVLVFFTLSSLLSRAWSGRKAAARALSAKGSRRDLGQVAANGGVPLVVLVLWLTGTGGEIAWIAFLGSVAAATADTWGTEVGTALRPGARLITTGRPVPAGASGGITLPGTIAGLLGAAVIGLTGWLVHPGWLAEPLRAVALAMVGGMTGSIVDSLLGATLQAQWWAEEGEWLSERRPVGAGSRERPRRGVAWVSNDVVNLLSAAAAAGTAAALWYLF